MSPFRSSRFLAVLAASIGITASAQFLSGPEYDAVLSKAFDTDSVAANLVCEATPILPELDFSLRFQTGFTMDLPLSQFDGPHHYGVMVFRVTPESGRPAYLMSRIDLPDTARTKLDGHVRGGFAVGAGKYKVEMIFVDDLHRVCRSQWRIEAKLDGSKYHLRAAVPPLTVAGVSPATQLAPIPANQPNLGRLTILMHVAPPSPQSAKLRARDALKLLGSLSALLEQLHARSARLVIFDLEQQKVLFRKDGFTATDLQDVAKLLNEAQFGLVDYSTLRNPGGSIDLLTQLTEEERGELHASDAMVFLGLHMELHGSIRSGVVKKFQGGARVFYLECESPSILNWAHNSGVGITAEASTIPSQTPEYADTNNGDRLSVPDQPDNVDNGDRSPAPDQPDNVDSLAPVDQRDIIEQLVRRLKGEIIPIRTPSDCARAIRRIEPHAKQQYSGGAKTTAEQSVDQSASAGH